RKKGRKNRLSGLPVMGIAKTAAIVLAVVGLVVGVAVLEKYVTSAEKVGALELVGAPGWVNQELKDRITDAAVAYGEDLRIDGDVAESVQSNIESLFAWATNVKVQTGLDTISIIADWRKPVGLVRVGGHKFYVDADMVVLDYVPVAKLAIVEVTGLAGAKRVPAAGDVWRHEDLAAAVAILVELGRWDGARAADKGLLFEIDRIDVSNFGGRISSKRAHIVLYTKDEIQIIWGAAIEQWQRYLEAPDEEKLAKLYAYYKKFGTLLGGARYINLRDPQTEIFQPIDK
ncbi:hypothetical protein ACFL3G_12395, partial [Planctomycetota bacterium]